MRRLLSLIGLCAAMSCGENAVFGGDLAAEIAGAAGKETTIVIDQPTAVDTALTVPRNITLEFKNSGRLDLAGSAKLEINGKIQAGRTEIFTGNGKVYGRPQIEAVYPEWFGARKVDKGNDAPAIQKAINLALNGTVYSISGQWGEQAIPVDLGHFKYYLKNGVKGSLYLNLRGDNATLTNMNGFPGDAFAVTAELEKGKAPYPMAAAVQISGIQFESFPNGIAIKTGNADQSQVLISDCRFTSIGNGYFYKEKVYSKEFCSPEFKFGTAIYLDSQSSLNRIIGCRFSHCHRVLYLVRGDYTVMERAWITVRPIVQDEKIKSLRYSPIVVKGGYLIMRDVMGIPARRGSMTKIFGTPEGYPGYPEPKIDPSIIYANQAENAWIANFAAVYCENVRFGGEYGGMAAVNNFAPATLYRPWEVKLVNCLLRSEFNEPAVRLFAVPNLLEVKDCYGIFCYRFGRFSLNGKDYRFKIGKILEFAPSLTAEEKKKIFDPESIKNVSIHIGNNHNALGLSANDLKPNMAPPELVPLINREKMN